MARYEYSEGSSNKFWEVTRAGSKLSVRWGRIGATPSEKVYELGSEEEAKKKHARLVAEKTGKGYALVSGKAKAERVTTIAAKGREHDIRGEPAMKVDVTQVEKHLGLPVGPVLRELIAILN